MNLKLFFFWAAALIGVEVRLYIPPTWLRLSSGSGLAWLSLAWAWLGLRLGLAQAWLSFIWAWLGSGSAWLMISSRLAWHKLGLTQAWVQLGLSFSWLGWTDRFMKNLIILQDFVPYWGRCPASTKELKSNLAGQGNC